jgi:16S rRNA (uracil1498-N3)-methyltransferase
MKKVRIYLANTDLYEGVMVACGTKQAHYITHVMRLGVGTGLWVFNGVQGLWQATVQDASKRGCTLRIEMQIAPQDFYPEIHLCFSPLKMHPQHFLIEKATELGVTHFHPLLMNRTVVRAFKQEKHLLTAIEACEQSERLTVPVFSPLLAADKFLAQRNPSLDCVYVGDERRQAGPLATVFEKDKKAFVMIGPEGGFTPGEFEMFKRHPAVRLITLNPHILRAETAALAAVAQLPTAPRA